MTFLAMSTHSSLASELLAKRQDAASTAPSNRQGSKRFKVLGCSDRCNLRLLFAQHPQRIQGKTLRLIVGGRVLDLGIIS